MDKLSEHAIRMLEIEGKGKNDGYIETRNMGDIARAVYDTILQVQMLKTALLHKTEPSDSEKPNNCEHITEDGVTCAKYPACDDCLDNPLNKVKGSERLVKGSGQTDCQTCKWWSSYGYCVHRECKGYEPQTERNE